MTAPLAYQCLVCRGVRAMPPALEVQCLATGCGAFARACRACVVELDGALLDERAVRRRLIERHAADDHQPQPLFPSPTEEEPVRP